MTLPPTIYTSALSRRSVRENGRKKSTSRHWTFSVRRLSAIRVTDPPSLQLRFATGRSITLAGQTTRMQTVVRASIWLVELLGLPVATPASSALLPKCLATSEKTLAQLSHLSTVPLNSTRVSLWVGNGVAWLRLWAGQPDVAIDHFGTSMRLNPLHRRAGPHLGIGMG